MAIQDYQNGEEKQHTLQDIAEPTQLVDQSRRSFTKTGMVASGVLLTLASRPVLGHGGSGYGGVCKSPSGFVSGNLSHHEKYSGHGGYSCKHWKTNCSSSDWGTCDRSKPFCDEFGFDCGDNPSYGCYVTHDFSHHKYTKNGRMGGSRTYVKYTNLDILCRYHAGYKPDGTDSDCEVDSSKDSYGNYKNNFYTSDSCGNITSYRKIDVYNDLDKLAQHCVAALLNCRAGLTPFLPESTVKEMFKECVAGRDFQPMANVYWDAKTCIEYIQSTWNCA